MTQYLHGPEVVVIDNPVTPIKVLRASVIGLVATADDADAGVYPLNKPVLVDSEKGQAKAGTTGTLKTALADISSQARALVVVVRVAEDADPNTQKANFIGAIQADESRTGLEALAHSESLTGVRPRLLIAPEYSHEATVGAQLESVAKKLRAIPIIDGSGGDLATVDAERQTYAKTYFVNPGVAFGNDTRKGSAVVAGHIVRCDNEFGYHQSPSNRKIFKITGTSKPVDHVLGEKTSLSNLYSEKNITTIVGMDGGFYLWGNNLADGTNLAHERINQIVADSVLLAHQRYIDRNIDADYVDSILTRVNNFLRNLVKRGVIAKGRVWFDPELNDDSALANKQAFFDYELALFQPCERLTLRQHSRLATTGEIFDVTE